MNTTETARPAEFEDIYPLTPMQNGILFHTLRSGRSGPYIEQFVFDVVGELDATRLAAAWSAVVNRHSTLRAAFVWEGVDEPVQVVVDECVVPLCEIDVTGCSRLDADKALANFITEDRARGFSLAEAPLMRLTVVRRDDGTVVVWTLHHLVMDGWSMPITIREVAAIYRASAAGEPLDLPQPRPFRDFIAWLARQPTEAATRFWREGLDGAKGFSVSPLLPGEPVECRGTARAGRSYHDLSPELSAALISTAQRGKVTLSTLFQAAWALLLARTTGLDDVIFGTAVSGRPADIADVDGIVGVFINTIPQRVRIDEMQSVRDLLREVQSQQLDSLPYQHIGLTEIQACSQVPGGAPLFDSIVVFENYPSENPDFDLGSGTTLVVREIIEDTGYPLTLTVLPRHPSIRLQLLYDAERFSGETATTLQGRLEAVLKSLVQHADGVVRSLSLLRAGHADRLLAAWNRTAPVLPAAIFSCCSASDGAGLRVHLLDGRLEPVPAGVLAAVHLVGDADRGRVTGWTGRHHPDGSIELIGEVGFAGGESAPMEPELAAEGEYRARPGVRTLGALWTEVLGRTIADPDSDFFRNGGDSLGAVRLIGRMRMTYETALTVNDVFEVRTLRGLVKRMDAELGADAVDRFAVERADA